MFVWWGTSSQTRRVKGGRKERAYCPECDRERTFVEVEVREAIKLFSVIDLFDDTERAFRCVDCDAVGQLVDGDVSPATERLSAEAAERLERARDAERQRQAEAERVRRERARRKREAKAEIELAELKAKMGLAEPPSDGDEDLGPEPDGRKPQRRWWKIWSR